MSLHYLGVGPDDSSIIKDAQNIYQYLMGGSELIAIALSPAIWLVLWIVTGSPRILPWRK